MGELEIIQTPGVIKYDFEGTKVMLKDKLEEYRGAVFTEDSKTYAKKTIAGLRSEKKELEKRVRETKKEWMVPFDNFEKDAKELIALYDEPIAFIDNQVKGFEEKRKAEKQEKIKEIYAGIVTPAIQEYIPLSKIYITKWENATYKEKDIITDIQELNDKVSGEIATIKAMNSEDETEALKRYSRTLDAMDAINFINERARVRADALERAKKAEEEAKIREAAERAKAEERAKIEAEQKAKETAKEAEKEKAAAVQEAKEEVIDNLTPDFSGEAKFYDYTIMLTPDAKEKLETFMDSVGIEYLER